MPLHTHPGRTQALKACQVTQAPTYGPASPPALATNSSMAPYDTIFAVETECTPTLTADHYLWVWTYYKSCVVDGIEKNVCQEKIEFIDTPSIPDNTSADICGQEIKVDWGSSTKFIIFHLQQNNWIYPPIYCSQQILTPFLHQGSAIKGESFSVFPFCFLFTRLMSEKKKNLKICVHSTKPIFRPLFFDLL